MAVYQCIWDRAHGWSCCHVVILSCCHIVMLSYCHVVMLSCCHIVMLSYCHVVLLGMYGCVSVYLGHRKEVKMYWS